MKRNSASTMNRTSKHPLLAIAIFAMSLGVCAAADQPTSSGAQKPKDVAPAASSSAKPKETTPPAASPTKPSTTPPASDVQKLTEQFTQQRDAILAQRQGLIDQLKNATDKQRAAIIKQIEAQQKQFEDAQRALYKQLRDDLRKERASKPPGVR
jgi:PBP1b-binding outer membrane lipoprotein LpoB